MTEALLLQRIRIALTLFVLGLVISGLTAFPLKWEIDLLARQLGTAADVPPESLDGFRAWIARVRDGLDETYAKYPFMGYGTDWLAFAHLVIAIAFIGPWRDPVRNRWVIDWGMICCALVIPLALICGQVRGIPIGWRLIDCSFGVLGIIPLALCRRWIDLLESIHSNAAS